MGRLRHDERPVTPTEPLAAPLSPPLLFVAAFAVVRSAASASPLGIGPRKICGAERRGGDMGRPPCPDEPLDLRNLAFFCVERNSVVLPNLRPLAVTFL